MRELKQRVNPLTDKVAGLESHQFSRDEHRFAASNVNQNINIKDLPRQPRVGINSRNTSDDVFKFGNTMDYNDRKFHIMH